MAAVLLRGLGPGVERGLAEVELHEHGESDALIGAFHGAIGPCGTTPCCRSWKTG